jgi:PAS domain S-box-containing protein
LILSPEEPGGRGLPVLFRTMFHERMSTNELFEALQALIEPTAESRPQQPDGTRDLLKELQVHQLELEIQNRELRQTQQQLTHSRTRYADLYDFSPLGYMSLDEQARIEEINITGGKLLGENPHKLIGRSFTEFIDPADIQDFTDHLRRCRRSRQKKSIELRLLQTLDRTPVEVQLFTMSTHDVDRHTLQFRTAFLNVTARKRAEEALRQSQSELEDKIAERTRELTASHNFLEAVISKAQDFIYAKDLDGRYQMINQAGADLIGRPAADIVGKSDCDVFPPETAQRLVNSHQTVLKARASLTFEALIGTHAGSADRWFQTTAGSYSDHTGKLIGVVGISRDITERRQREDAQRFLSEASAVLSASLDYEITLWNVARAALPHLADACVVDMVQDDGTIRRVSAAHISPDKESLLWELEVAGDDVDVSCGRAKVIRTGRPELYENIPESVLSNMARDRKHVDLLRSLSLTSLMCVPLVVRGETTGCLSFMLSRADRRYNLFDLALAEDLADRASIALDNAQLYSKEQEANRLKDQFLATVSHELRTPLMPILGAIYKLRSTHGGDQDLQAALDMIERNAKSQARIVEDLLDVSRITTGSLDVKRQPADLLSIIERAVEVIRPAAEALGIHVNTSLEKPREPVWCDRDRIQQVIWNLLSNAIKFTRQDGTIEVQLQDIGRAARIRIADTGVGIQPEFLPHVFERFRQADNFSTRAHGGLGVGLAIVRYIVERHGGTVRAESEGAGKGTAFIVELPYK